MRSRRPDLRELRGLVRAAEPGSYNIAHYIREHGVALGLTGVTGPDEIVAPRLRALLDDARVEQDREVEEENAAALRQVQTLARWRGEEVVFPPSLFFWLTTPATGKKYIRFVGAFDVVIPRHRLHRAGVALRAFREIAVAVDGAGVHLRWPPHGGLNFYPVRLGNPADALVVSLPGRIALRRLPALLGEVLAEMGFGP